MNIKPRKDGEKLIVAIEGRIDTVTAPELVNFVQNDLTDVKDLELDLAGVDYVSSAGLRAFLLAQKIMNKQGKMVLSHVCEEIMETFELTGFVDVLTVI